MREPMTEQRLREVQEVAWSPAYRPPPDFPEHVYRHDLFRDAVREVERLRGTAREWRSTLAALQHVLAEHRITMPIEPGRPGPPKLIADLMEWVATAVECETHWQRRRVEQTAGEAARLRSQMAEAATLLGHFVDHEDDPCSFDHHGACNQHSGSGLRRCDVAIVAWLGVPGWDACAAALSSAAIEAAEGADGRWDKSADRGICPRCGKDVHVRVDGTLNAHNRPRSLDRCGGSHKAAAVEQPVGVDG